MRGAVVRIISTPVTLSLIHRVLLNVDRKCHFMPKLSSGKGQEASPRIRASTSTAITLKWCKGSKNTRKLQWKLSVPMWQHQGMTKRFNPESLELLVKKMWNFKEIQPLVHTVNAVSGVLLLVGRTYLILLVVFLSVTLSNKTLLPTLTN